MANEFHYSVSLCIVHPTVDPRSITKELTSLRPAIEKRAGDERRSKDGKPLVPRRKTLLSVWLANLHDEERLYSGVKPLSVFIVESLAKLEGHRDLFFQLRQQGNVALRVGWFSDSNYSAEVLSSDALKKCGDLGLDIELNCYWNWHGKGDINGYDASDNE
jgi:hypothetical protein